MRNFSVAWLAALAMLPLLAFSQLTRPSQAQLVDPCEGLQKWNLFVEGEPIDEFVARIRDEGRVADFIRGSEALGIDLEIPDLTALVQRIDADPASREAVPVQMQGIGGFSTTVLLKKLLLDENNEPIADQVVYGKIRDYTFVEETKSAHLSVDVCTDRREFVPLGQDRREFFHWDIETDGAREVPGGAFSVVKRDDPPNPNNRSAYSDKPFPGVDLLLPKEATDPNDPNSIWRRGLDYKLHAKGEVIHVRGIYFRKLSNPNLELLPPDHRYYNGGSESCVDLFTEGRPPATFGELLQKDYCLGRCEYPAIYSTGGG